MTPIFLSAAKENFSENQAKTYPSHGGSYSSDCSYRVERQKDQKKGLPPREGNIPADKPKRVTHLMENIHRSKRACIQASKKK